MTTLVNKALSMFVLLFVKVNGLKNILNRTLSLSINEDLKDETEELMSVVLDSLGVERFGNRIGNTAKLLPRVS
ncbi:MAG: hypothetical protein QXL96_08925 [Ignisphaera sp.]